MILSLSKLTKELRVKKILFIICSFLSSISLAENHRILLFNRDKNINGDDISTIEKLRLDRSVVEINSHYIKLDESSINPDTQDLLTKLKASGIIKTDFSVESTICTDICVTR